MNDEHRAPGQLGRATRFLASLDGYVEGVTSTLPELAAVMHANLYTSEPADAVLRAAGVHAPVIDLDFPCELIPSTTEGHFHLVMDRYVPWEAYKKLLAALADAGLVEEGYVRASIARGYSTARLPWVKKPSTAPEACAA